MPFFTDKGRAFFARPETMESCRQIAQLADTVARLETELGIAPSPTSAP